MTDEPESDAAFTTLMRLARHEVEQSREILSEVRKSQQNQWQAMAGSELSAMLVSREATEERLESTQSNLRIVALSLLINHWGPDDRFAILSEKLASTDADPQVRGVAIVALGRCYVGTKQKNICELLATIILNCDNLPTTRFAAYAALLDLNGIPLNWDGLKNRPFKPFQFPADVDWDFVGEFAK